MFSIPSTRVYLSPGSTDMRKSISGLSILVGKHLEMDPFSGHIFAFCNHRKNIIKILYWDRNGFCLWQKRLEKERFPWPSTKAAVKEIQVRQLRWLLDGLDIHQTRGHLDLKYSIIF
jgi:transposase